MMDIKIDKEKVFDNVVMNASIIARDLFDANGNSLYDKVVIRERDKDLLETNFNKAFSVLKTLLRDFMKEVKDYVITIDNPDNNGVLAESIEEMANTYMVERLCADWLKLKSPEHAAIYLNESESSLDELKKKVYFKDAPKLKLYGEE